VGALQPGHLLVILAIVVLIFGPGKLGNVGKALGQGLKEFRKGADVGDDSRPSPAANAARACPSCHALVPARDKFCGVCGRSIA
jgi:sec-independent protein translocase protein TatA